MIMKTSDGKIIEILFKDENGFCTCDDGWKRPVNELTIPTKLEVNKKRKEPKQREK